MTQSNALIKDAQALVTNLSRVMEMPDEAAVAWVHSAALSAHAVGLGLIEDSGSIAGNVEAIAKANPALAPLADPAVNRMWDHWLIQERQDVIADLWRRRPIADDPHRPDGYQLGDLYQALSVEARKGRALCQTPRFVSDLLLNITVPPAIDRWGLDGLRMIDPACGTGHILIEAFVRVWTQMGGRHDRRPFDSDRIARAVAAVHGVDLDPYAAAVASYRLLALACRMGGGARRLDQVPAEWTPRVVAADSLLDADELLLRRGQYHVVIGNPPYITVKDAGLNERIRAAYPQVCSGKYSLALPFAQLMTELAMPGGWIAQLTANSFMKREFGRKFVQDYLPRFDLRWVIDTSGAYIPGHGTPTVILVHRNQAPTGDTVSSVLGVRGEPSTPTDPAEGVVWTAIRDAVQTRLAYQQFAAAGAPPKPAPDVVPPGRPEQLDLFALAGAA